jgi:hypothetical protein
MLCSYILIQELIDEDNSALHLLRFEEDPGKGHWYPDVLRNPITQCFLDKHLASEATKPPLADFFCLTVTAPQESGSLRGWKICQLKVPGRYSEMCSPQKIY